MFVKKFLTKLHKFFIEGRYEIDYDAFNEVDEIDEENEEDFPVKEVNLYDDIDEFLEEYGTVPDDFYFEKECYSE